MGSVLPGTVASKGAPVPAPIGHLLARMPLDVRLGTMCIYGAIFQCLVRPASPPFPHSPSLPPSGPRLGFWGTLRRLYCLPSVEVVFACSAMCRQQCLTGLPSTRKMLLILWLCGLKCSRVRVLCPQDPVLTIAAALSSKPMFSSTEDKGKVTAAKLRMDMPRDGHRTFSDHLSVVKAYNGWKAQAAMSFRAGRQYCFDNCLSLDAM